MKIKNLEKKSLSLSKFSFVRINNLNYVRKNPPKIDQRELQSILKQNKFKTYYAKDIKVFSIKIKLEKSKKNSSGYLMSFFEGKTGEDVFTLASIYDINKLSIFFNDFFNKNKKISKYFRVDTDIYKNKILDIENKINKFNFPFIKNKIIPEIKNLLKSSYYFPDIKTCHGDLTFSNIIVSSKKKEIALIDFQNTFHDNIMQDFAKIYIEFNLKMSARFLNESNLLKSDIIYESILQEKVWKNLPIKFKKSLKLEVLISLLRMVPYLRTNDEVTKNWLEKSFEKMLRTKI